MSADGPVIDLPPLGSDSGSGPDSNPLASYNPPDRSADIFAASAPEVTQAWRRVAAGLAGSGGQELSTIQQYLNRNVADLGMAYRHTGDEQERPWPLNPMPIIIGAGEWATLEEGLVERAELLETVIADLYGEQKLVSDKHLPAAVVSGSENFARRLVGMKPAGVYFLQVYAVDLARGPKGDWRVLADRVRLPSGIGYALENRLALSRATGGLLASVGTRKQNAFYDALRQGIAARCLRADPRMALLTPGRFSQSYPEQAHLARSLGISLVEGRDLTVRENKLYVRTISGLKRIDALWRWIGTRDIDPLNFDTRSKIGVPNLIDAAAKGLVLANWPGAGVVESRAMPAFLPRLARQVLGGSLKLPNAATWWCGGEKERNHVLENLDNLVVSSAFRRPLAGLPDGHTRLGSSLSPEEREELQLGMARRPMDYTAQEVVRLSTTPALAGGQMEPRGFTMRAFLARDENGKWTILQGGFARMSQSGDLRTSLMGLGDISTDVCIVHPAATVSAIAPPSLEPPVIRRSQGLLPSQAADNLYWLGRYSERAHQTVRIIRTLLEQVAISGEGMGAVTAVTRLANLLRWLGAAPKESTRWQPSRLAGAALSDKKYPGTVRLLTEHTSAIALLLRDRLPRDGWRAILGTMPHYTAGDLESMSSACDRLIERFAALSSIMADGLTRGPPWSFLEMGTRIERASMILQSARAMVPGSASAEDLSALLDLVDGQSLYRSRYVMMPFIAPVFDMVLLDPAQPRGLAFQIEQIEQHLALLPSQRQDGLPEGPLRIARQLRARIEGLDAGDIDSGAIDSLAQNLAKLSDAIGRRYFLQDDSPLSKAKTNILG